MREDVYTHGHHDSVLRSHRWRTAENSADHLLPHLESGQRVLDVGCGPGTITVDLGRLVAPGEVVGVDLVAGVLEEAEQVRAQGRVDNVTFQVGDVYALDFEDGSFDVVHAHQVLQHLTDPVAALREMRRVLRPGGILAVRDSVYDGFFWAPDDRRLDRWLELYKQVTSHNHANADAGRHLLAWTRQAGFDDPVATSSTWTFADPETRTWWGGLWADRARYSDFAKQALEYGLTTQTELEEIAAAWLDWAADDDALLVITHVRVIARA